MWSSLPAEGGASVQFVLRADYVDAGDLKLTVSSFLWSDVVHIRGHAGVRNCFGDRAQKLLGVGLLLDILAGEFETLEEIVLRHTEIMIKFESSDRSVHIVLVHAVLLWLNHLHHRLVNSVKMSHL